jgi:hypothetical protein
MLTSYLVKCPHSQCQWFGSLIPLPPTEAWRKVASVKSEVVFHCPQCDSEWHAQIVGDDVKPLPVQELALVE